MVRAIAIPIAAAAARHARLAAVAAPRRPIAHHAAISIAIVCILRPWYTMALNIDMNAVRERPCRALVPRDTLPLHVPSDGGYTKAIGFQSGRRAIRVEDLHLVPRAKPCSAATHELPRRPAIWRAASISR